MRRALGESLRKQFAAAVSDRLRSYTPAPDALLPPGSRAWRSEHPLGLATFLVLFVHPKRDQFTLDGAWSRHGLFPAMLTPRRPRDWPNEGITRDTPVDGEFCLRIPELWQPRGHWWQLVTESEWRTYADGMMAGITIPPELPLGPAMDRIPSAVDDAISRTVQYYVPYIESVARGDTG